MVKMDYGFLALLGIIILYVYLMLKSNDNKTAYGGV